jgi:DNA-directed DNA polymerase III PolC
MGSTASIPALIEKATQDGFQSLTLTDTNVLYGAIKFSTACEKSGIHPLIGMEVLVESPLNLPSDLSQGGGKLVLIAQNQVGYQSLCRLSSSLKLHASDKSSGVDTLPWVVLSENTEGLLVLEGGREGWVERLVARGQVDQATQFLSRLAGLSRDSCLLGIEIQLASDLESIKEILSIGQRFGTPAVPMLPIYCCEEEERERLRLLTAIRLNLPLQDVPTSDVPGRDDPSLTIHWLRPQEVRDRYKPIRGALTDISVVRDACDEGVLPSGRAIWPVITLAADRKPIEVLREQARIALENLYPGDELAKAVKRLEFELDLIDEGGFAPLFLVVADIARYARESSIPMNTRGSVANSLVAFCMGITQVDPLEHDLLFERFLNPERKDLPDIDLDFCSRRRDEVLNYLRKKYGEDRVAMVATVNTMQPRSAIRETAKAYGHDEAEIKSITAGLGRWWHPDPRRRGRGGIEAKLQETTDPTEREILMTGEQIIGQPRHLSVHPGGVIITPSRLTDVVPIQLAPKGFVITQFDHEDVESIGLPKIDLLGIRALSVMAKTVELIRRFSKPEFDLEKIPEQDAKTGDILEKGETIGVFQCESEGAQTTLRKLRAREVKDLAVANAYFKPGPATGGMAEAFVRRYRGDEPVDYLHPSLEPILQSTRGVLIFQEQILRVTTEIAGLSWEEANHLRRGMTKFRPDEMESLKNRFIHGCMRPEPEGPALDKNAAETLWEQVHAFAGYGFNKGHSTSYAGVSYRMAYLKCYWPEAFLCARLSEHGGYHHPAVYMAEARRLGIRIHPPHINMSESRFTLSSGESAHGKQPELWMGLNQVRDLRRTTIQRLMEERAVQPFSGVLDLSRRVKLQERELIHLVQCGAMDGLVANRARGIREAETVLRSGSPLQHHFDFFEDQPVETESTADRLAWERRILGLPMSAHPLEGVKAVTNEGVALEEVVGQAGRKLITHATRLPSWGSHRTFFMSDQAFFLRVKVPEDREVYLPEVWAPVRLGGTWKEDPWGGGWFEADHFSALS